MLLWLQESGFAEIESVEELESLVPIHEDKRGPPFWLDVSQSIFESTLGSVEGLGKLFALHELITDHQENLEQCKLFEDQSFLSLQTAEATWVKIIHSDQWVITFHAEPFPRFSALTQRLGRIQKVSLTSGWILYLILDNIVDGFFQPLQEIEADVKKIDELAFNSQHPENDVMDQIIAAKRSFHRLQRLIVRKSEVIKKMNSRSSKFRKALLSKEVMLYMSDVHGHIKTIEQNLQSLLETLNKAHSGVLAHVSVELTLSSNRLNQSTKMFAGVACIFAPLILMTTVMGVNLQVPFNVGGPLDSPLWFWLFVGFMVTLATILVFVGRKFGWWS